MGRVVARGDEQSSSRHSYTTPESQCRQQLCLGRRQRFDVAPCRPGTQPAPRTTLCPPLSTGWAIETTKAATKNAQTFDCTASAAAAQLKNCKRCTPQNVRDYICVCKCDRRSYFSRGGIGPPSPHLPPEGRQLCATCCGVPWTAQSALPVQITSFSFNYEYNVFAFEL